MENQTKEISSWGSGQKTGGGQINIKQERRRLFKIWMKLVYINPEAKAQRSFAQCPICYFN